MSDKANSVDEEAADEIIVDRPPRIQPELPFEERELAGPPDKDVNGWMRLLQAALPMLTIVGYLAVMGLGGRGRTPIFMLPMAFAVVAAVIFSIYTYRQDLRRRKELIRRYDDYLAEQNREMKAAHDQQRRFYGHNYPDTERVFAIVDEAREEAQLRRRPLRSRARLWERRTDDEDFGVIRLGIGTLPSTVVYKTPDADPMNDDPQMRGAQRLAEDSLFVDEIPVVISLQGAPTDRHDALEKDDVHLPIPRTHALAVSGESRDVYAVVRNILSQLSVFHTPDDVRMLILADHSRPWQWLETLPHARNDELNRMTCFLDQADEDDAAYNEGEDGGPAGRFLEGVRRILAQRRLQSREDTGEAGKEGPSKLPFLLLVVDLLDAAYDADSPLQELEADAAVSIILEEGNRLGAALLVLTPDRSKVPSKCTAVIEVEQTAAPANRRVRGQKQLHFRYTETGINSPRYVGKADATFDAERYAALAEAMAECKARKSYGSDIARVAPFLSLMGYPTLRALQQDVAAQWAQSTTRQQSDWLRAKLGLMAANKPRTLHFSAKRDGVHGMIAGSTGSGKSELLISLISGMAVTYDPSVVNFVLVDFKGGGAFDAFRSLPHCVNVITNLDQDGVTRMFTAIHSEMQRRQWLNTKTGTKDIVEYWQKGYHLPGPDGRPGEAYPFLFIIIDEFAEMIAERSEFRSELESITRVGRAQGVSLILAAQRPSGVTDQMRSNIKFRICLRVETPTESRELLRRPDAAFLPSGLPGRGLLQVGNDEVELVQVAYTGEPYVDPEPVLWPNRRRDYLASYRESPELYKVIIKMLERTADEQNVPRQLAPWPEFLPRELTLTQLLITDDGKSRAVTAREYLAEVEAIIQDDEGIPAQLTLSPALNHWQNGECGWRDFPDWERYAIRPVVGLIDDPYRAKQLPLVIDLPQGHAVMFGASGWGKTTFVRTLAISLAANYSPDHLHLYLLDLGGRNLDILEKLPHVGAVINPDEEGYRERVMQLMRELETVVSRRKETLAEAGLNTIYDYNRRHPDKTLPAIVTIIDNFIEFQETFDTGEEGIETAFDKFIELARQGKPYGIHLVITIGQVAALSGKLYSLFTERFTLKLADAGEYRAVVGAGVGEISGIPGHGYLRSGAHPLTFQIARPFDLQGVQPGETGNENDELRGLISHMHDHMARTAHAYREPLEVGALPKSLLFRELLTKRWNLTPGADLPAQIEQRTAQNWRRSTEKELADWLRVTIGAVSGNRLRKLHFAAAEDGVHGLIAGGTGSGKSELLMTLIVGLALNYDPSILNFVLVDYKGGGAFLPFRNLPHCVDIITNLNKTGVQRMFTAIEAEMERRQQLNAQTGTKDIVEYRAEGYHETLAPYPHLFVIIDEYAEMITDNPEFKEQLDSITRLGRAQGVNLLLAAQRPVGVTDQMRANIKYRICLRVEGVETSREMLRRSDAAFLPGGIPGRGYLQIGNDAIELMQVAWTGEDYALPDQAEDERPAKFYDVMVEMARGLWAADLPRAPWPDPLPRELTLTDGLDAAYWQAEGIEAVTLGQRPFAGLNGAVTDWLNGKPAWQGVDWTRNALQGVVGLVDDPGGARQLPLIINLTRGHAALFGAAGWGKTTFLRTLIASLAATHSPDEFQAHVLDMGGRNLQALRALPHVGTVIMPDERGFEERVDQLRRELENIVDERRRLLAEAGVSTLIDYNQAHPQAVEPAIVVAIDNFGEFIQTFGDSSQANDADTILGAYIGLMRQAMAYGIHFVITAQRPNTLSSKVYSLFGQRLTLRLADADDYRAVVGSSAAPLDEIPGRGYVRIGRKPLEFQVALAVGDVNDEIAQLNETKRIQYLGARMQAAGAESWSGKAPFAIDALPASSSYRQVLADAYGFPLEPSYAAGLLKAMRTRWTETADNSDWLAYILGIVSGNKQKVIRMSAKEDGVHGLIAGGTGSGKSELLMTMIAGLAVNYSPDLLNFVLVDYKGGGAFRPFAGLPHCVDIVTNLNKAAVARMFTAINAEIRRRQQLNTDTGAKDIVDYRRRNLHRTREPYPHLFIIIDEYAEMIDDNPEYKSELESITRVGRALGVNLILASQRPKGVTDQMRANIKLRICLRVEEMDTSREMLRRVDAALLPNGLPGRGYLQIGNENIELIQVSYTGEDQPDDRPLPVQWPMRTNEAAAVADEEPPKLFETIVALARELTGGSMAPKPWPDFLPTAFSLQSVLEDAQANRDFLLLPEVNDWLNGEAEQLWPGIAWQQNALTPVAGLLDDPADARQDPLRFDLRNQHLIIFGDSGSGKSTLLRTIATSLAATHSPDELHVYVLDLGGRSFRTLEELPHTGSVIYADEERYDERLNRLFSKLTGTLEERQKFLSEADAGTLWEYNARGPEQMLPAILVLIDNLPELTENYVQLVENIMVPLIRRSLPMGIAFAVTANTNSGIPSRLYSLFSDRITFRQSNPDLYLDIVGRGAVDFGSTPGRGYRRQSGGPLMFQAALPVGLFDEDDERIGESEAEAMRRMAGEMHARFQARADTPLRPPDPIKTLPELVPLQALLARTSASARRHAVAVLGQNGELEPALCDLQRMGPHFAVTGPPFSGKSTVLYSWVLSLADRYPPAQVRFVLIDIQRRFIDYGGGQTLAALPHTVAAVTELDELPPLLAALQNECIDLAVQTAVKEQEQEIFVFIDNFDDFEEELSFEQQKQMAQMARRYGRDGLHFVIAGALDGSGGELRRRIQASNYGIGLRTAQALDNLRVGKHPAGLRGRELAVGRGYTVKSGQAAIIQTASPYELDVSPILGLEEEEMEERNQAALDNWIARILARYDHEPAAAWTQTKGSPGEETTTGTNSQTNRAIEMLRRVVSERKDEHADVAALSHVDVLVEMIKPVLYDKVEGGAVIVDLLSSADDILNMADEYLPALDDSGENGSPPRADSNGA
ncbi:MAG: NACHT domain-containing protein [Caldilineaceae bacterium]|nr:NACHT domain-containing protein [Caldilineaceae bacterium]